MSKEFDPHKVQKHDYLLKYTIIPLIPKRVTPNHFTIVRMIMIPFVIVLLVMENYALGVPLFFFAALTDMIDGSLARLRHQVTDWGSLYDPVADKLLISTVLIVTVAQHINPWLALVIIGLEIIMVIGGIIRTRHGFKVQANTWGKIKMCLQVTGVMALLITLWLGVDLFIPFSTAVFYVAIVFAVISLYTYGI